MFASFGHQLGRCCDSLPACRNIARRGATMYRDESDAMPGKNGQWLAFAEFPARKRVLGFLGEGFGFGG